jgi:hypothetical protein
VAERASAFNEAFVVVEGQGAKAIQRALGAFVEADDLDDASDAEDSDDSDDSDEIEIEET